MCLFVSILAKSSTLLACVVHGMPLWKHFFCIKVSLSSVRRSLSIHCHMGGSLLFNIPATFSLFLTKIFLLFNNLLSLWKSSFAILIRLMMSVPPFFSASLWKIIHLNESAEKVKLKSPDVFTHNLNFIDTFCFLTWSFVHKIKWKWR